MDVVYTSGQIQSMNSTNIWKNSIHIYKPDNHNKKQQYELHAMIVILMDESMLL